MLLCGEADWVCSAGVLNEEIRGALQTLARQQDSNGMHWAGEMHACVADAGSRFFVQSEVFFMTCALSRVTSISAYCHVLAALLTWEFVAETYHVLIRMPDVRMFFNDTEAILHQRPWCCRVHAILGAWIRKVCRGA